MSTVGYGDLYPETDAGRVIVIAVMLVGIGFLTMLIGAVAERFTSPAVERVEDELADDDATVLAELRSISERLARVESRLDQTRP